MITDYLFGLYPLFTHLSFKRRRQFLLLLLFSLLSAAAELISLSAVVPFLAALINPQALLNYSFLNGYVEYFAIDSSNQLLNHVTLAFLVSIILCSAIRMINLRLNVLMSSAIGSDLSIKCFSKTLCQPYQFHLTQNSSIVISTVTQHINRTVSSLNAFLQLFTGLLVTIALLLGLVVIDVWTALSAGLILAFVYSILALTARKRLARNSKQITLNGQLLVRTLQESFGAIRDIVLHNTHAKYISYFSRSDFKLRRYQANNIFLGAFPRYLLESVAMFTLVLVGYISINSSNNNVDVIPTLGAFALGSQKLLPAMQQVYSGWTTIRGAKDDNYAVLKLLEQGTEQTSNLNGHPIAFNFSDTISLRQVVFSYTSNSPAILDNVDFDIIKGQTIGIIGPTGGGKSTLIDVLMGLLIPSSGHLCVDHINLSDPLNYDSLCSWRSAISYVPQSIYLSDSSIAENITFESDSDSIDIQRMITAANIAQLHDFVTSLPDQYSTTVGERGVRLSGGQIQRIGIARAIYRQAQILILDEATSALDKDTESAILRSIYQLNPSITIIMVAHRLSTLYDCDTIYSMKDGKISIANDVL